MFYAFACVDLYSVHMLNMCATHCWTYMWFGGQIWVLYTCVVFECVTRYFSVSLKTRCVATSKSERAYGGPLVCLSACYALL